MSDLIFVDTETTGLVPGQHAIIQLAALIDTGGEVTDRLNLKIRLPEWAEVSPEALEVNGQTIEGLENDPERIPYEEAMDCFLKFAGVKNYVRPERRPHFVGYNSVGFDFPHMCAMAQRCGVSYFFAKFNWPGIDVAVLACDHLRPERGTMPNFKLMNVARHLGVDTDGTAHDALFDVEVTRKLYYKILAGRRGKTK